MSRGKLKKEVVLEAATLLTNLEEMEKTRNFCLREHAEIKLLVQDDDGDTRPLDLSRTEILSLIYSRIVHHRRRLVALGVES